MNFKKIFCIAAAALFLTGCDTNLRPYMLISPEATMAEFQEAVKFTPPDDGTALLCLYRPREKEKKEDQLSVDGIWLAVMVDRKYHGTMRVPEFAVMKLEPGDHQIVSKNKTVKFNAGPGEIIYFELRVMPGTAADPIPMFERQTDNIEMVQRLLKRDSVMINFQSPGR